MGASTITNVSKGRRTAERLLDAAELLFAQKGYEATSLRDIATEVEIQQPALYRHFDSKDDLYRQVLQRALQPLTDEMDAAMLRHGGEAPFRNLTDRLVEVLRRHPNVPLLLIRSLISPPSQRDDIGLEWVERLADYGRRITKAAERETATGELAVQIIAIFNILFGYFWAAPLVRGLFASDPLDPAMIDRQKALLAHFIDALDDSARPR